MKGFALKRKAVGSKYAILTGVVGSNTYSPTRYQYSPTQSRA